ncbi:MAG: hypothetical protein NWE98_10525 [Candidatus Bathyarchaeota archaeon]|nr:hypothetical protein [Candidatus Bathyarchaeota archaeon]
MEYGIIDYLVLLKEQSVPALEHIQLLVDSAAEKVFTSLQLKFPAFGFIVPQ